MINGTAAAAPSALRLMVAGRLRIGLSIALASLHSPIARTSLERALTLRVLAPNRKNKSGYLPISAFLVGDQGLEPWTP